MTREGGSPGERAAPLVIRRSGRRVSTAPMPGWTDEPAGEQEQEGEQRRSSENDAQLRRDVPPHWG